MEIISGYNYNVLRGGLFYIFESAGGEEVKMALITERVRDNSRKCKDCVLQKARDYMSDYSQLKQKTAGKGVFDRDTSLAFTKLAKRITFATTKFSCNMCPYQEDFKKVYGMSPSGYFVEVQERMMKES